VGDAISSEIEQLEQQIGGLKEQLEYWKVRGKDAARLRIEQGYWRKQCDEAEEDLELCRKKLDSDNMKGKGYTARLVEAQDYWLSVFERKIAKLTGERDRWQQRCGEYETEIANLTARRNEWQKRALVRRKDILRLQAKLAKAIEGREKWRVSYGAANIWWSQGFAELQAQLDACRNELSLKTTLNKETE
jgi:chromosome segregation ATPase